MRKFYQVALLVLGLLCSTSLLANIPCAILGASAGEPSNLEEGFLRLAQQAGTQASEAQMRAVHALMQARLLKVSAQQAPQAIHHALTAYKLYVKNVPDEFRSTFLFGLWVKVESPAELEYFTESLLARSEALKLQAIGMRVLTTTYLRSQGLRYEALRAYHRTLRQVMDSPRTKSETEFRNIPLFTASKHSEDMLTVETAAVHRLLLAETLPFNNGVPFNFRYFQSKAENWLEISAAQHLSAENEAILGLGDESVRTFQTPGFGKVAGLGERQKACDFLSFSPEQNALRLRELKSGAPAPSNIETAVKQLRTTYAAIKQRLPDYKIDRVEIILDSGFANYAYLLSRTLPISAEPNRYLLLDHEGRRVLHTDASHTVPITVRLMPLLHQ